MLKLIDYEQQAVDDAYNAINDLLAGADVGRDEALKALLYIIADQFTDEPLSDDAYRMFIDDAILWLYGYFKEKQYDRPA